MRLCFFVSSVGQNPNDDISKAVLFEGAMSSIFEAICAKETPNVARILLTALRESKQDVRPAEALTRS